MDNSQIQYYRGLIRQLEANLTNAINRIKVSENRINELSKKIVLGTEAPSTLDAGVIPADYIPIHDHLSQEEGGPAYAVYYPD